MLKLKVKKPHKFADKQVVPGDLIEATEKEADVLRALGWAEDVSTETSRPTLRTRRNYERRDMNAAK